jgi:membrane protease YdiL (CAAX protease family)
VTGGAAAATPRRRAAAARLPSWLADNSSHEQREPEAVSRRRRRVVAVASVAGAGLLGASLSAEPDSTRFYVLALGTAGTWLTGGLVSGPLQLGWAQAADGTLRRPVIEPVASGAAAFGIFYGAALLARRIPILNEAIASVLRYAHQGSDPLVLATTLANGLGEEIFFRGGIFSAVGVNHPVAASTAAYTLAAAATRNPALVVASGVMGTLFARQRRASGGIQAPILTHLTWSTLMLRFLPPLFREPSRYDAGGLGSCLPPRILAAARAAAPSARTAATRRPRRRFGASS